ncbi:MAG TPA: acyl-phosphate glycerol 3-phosphate acyltransferase [Dehalococcoidia bacterium]|nr:acyl-phosphate glycerol 3-phosphate acyltransferase [Dehalococcoidia bacterium]
MIIESILAILIAYLLGAIPFAYIAGRLKKGVDIRRLGGGNVGTTNALREIGTGAGLLVFAGDVLKGVLAIFIAQWLGVSLIIVFIAGLAAVIGHNWSVFIKFSGGKGGATVIGVFLALVPVFMGIAFAIMLLVAFLTSNLRLSMMAGFIALPFLLWGFGEAGNIIAYSVALPLLTGLRILPSIIKGAKDPQARKNFIVDRDYTPWQKKKKQK